MIKDLIEDFIQRKLIPLRDFSNPSERRQRNQWFPLSTPQNKKNPNHGRKNPNPKDKLYLQCLWFLLQFCVPLSF